MTDLTLLGHSAVRLSSEGRTLVIDPGVFSDLGGLADADAVLITHGHADHVAAPALTGIQAGVWAPSDVIDQLAEAGIPAERLHAVGPGAAFTAAGFEVQVLGGEHAVIHPVLPGAHNNAYLVDGTVLHTGDSLVPAPDPTAVTLLLLPVAAPWLRLADAIDLAREHTAATVLPIHDAILSAPGKQLTDGILGAVLRGAYQRPEAGSIVSI